MRKESMRKTTSLWSSGSFPLVSLLLVFALFSSPALAANDPGHDTLYIEQQGDSNLTGTLNISDELGVGKLIKGGGNLDILGNGSQPGNNLAEIYASDTQSLYFNAPGNFYFGVTGGGSTVYLGSSGVHLNVSGNIYATGDIYSGGTLVCLANGTNCLSGNNSGNVSSVTAGSGLTDSGTAADPVLNVGAGAGITVNADNVTINSAYTQRRVSGTCSAGQAIDSINEDGTVSCATLTGSSSAGGWTNNSENTTTTLNVGIGTTTPNATLGIEDALTAANQAVLSLRDSTASGAFLQLTEGTNNANSFLPQFRARSEGFDGGGVIFIGLIPTAKDIAGTDNVAAMMFDARQDDGSALGAPLTTAKLFSWRNYGALKMVLDVNGKLGLGSDSTPDAQLAVDSSSNTNVGLIVQGAASQSANLQEWQDSAGSALASVNASGTIFDASGQVCTASNGLCTTAGDGSGGWSNTSTTTSTSLDVNVTTGNLTVVNGRVGIGTDSPQYALDVRKTGGGYVNVQTSAADSVAGIVLHNDARQWAIETVGTGNDGIRFYDYTAPGTRFFISTAGLVGIGSDTTPDGQLAVDVGSSSTTGLIVQGAASQSANLTEWQNSSGSTMAYIDASGQLNLNADAYGINGGLFFAGGNTGIYASSANVLVVANGGGTNFEFTGSNLRSWSGTGPNIISQAMTSTNPGYSIRGDLDTGIGWAGADNLSLITGGVEAVRVTDAQNVDVTGNITMNGGDSVCTASNGLCAGATQNTSVGGGWTNTSTTTSTDLDVNVASGKFFVNSSNGYIGIGTSTPSSAIDMETYGDILFGVGAASSNNQLTVRAAYISTKNAQIAIDAGRYASLKLQHNGTSKWVLKGDWQDSDLFSIGGGANGGTHYFSINNANGKVGIGTDSPTQKLDVNGSGNFSGTNAQLWVNGSAVCTASNGLCGGGTVGGTGTSGTLTKWDTNGQDLVDSIVSESGTLLTVAGSSNTTGTIYVGTSPYTGKIFARGSSPSGLLIESDLAIHLVPSNNESYMTTFSNNAITTTGTIATNPISGGPGTKGISSTITHASTGATVYGVYANLTTNQKNVAGYFSATGGNENHGLIVGAGDVGIGTDSPTQKLDVNGSINVSDASGKVYTPELCLNGNCQTSWPSGADGTGGWTNTSTYTTTSLKVGIGISPPTAKLDVRGGDIYVLNNGGNPRFVIGDSTNSGEWGGAEWNSANDVYEMGTSYGYPLKVAENSKVEIGTDYTPDAQLAVDVQNASYKGLIVQGSASQSANLTEWQNSGGSALAYVNASGTIYDASGQVCTASNGLCAGATQNTSVGGGWSNTSTTTSTSLDVNVTSRATNAVPLTIHALSGQTANLQEWQNSSGDAVAKVTKDGNIVLASSDLLGVSTPSSYALQVSEGSSGKSIGMGVSAAGGIYLTSFSNPLYLNRNAENIILGSTSSGYVAVGDIISGAKFGVQTGVASYKGIIVKGAASQSANLQEWQNSGGSTLAYVNASGTIYDSSGQVCTASNGLCAGATQNTSVGGGWTNTSTTTSTSLDVNVASGKFFVNSTNGRVGIGTTTPGNSLTVSKNQDATTNIQVVNGNAGATAKSGVFVGNAMSGGLYGGMEHLGTGFTTDGVRIPRRTMFSGSDTGGAGFGTNGAYNAVFFTDKTERMRITGTGEIGIGTASPTQLLDVNGSINITGSSGDLNIENGVLKVGGTERIDNSGVATLAATSTVDGSTICTAANGLCGGASSGGGWTNTTTTTSTDLNVNVTTGNLTVPNGAIGVGVTNPASPVEIRPTNYENILRFTDSGVAHGMTGVVPTNVFFSAEEVSDNMGGAQLRGLTDSDASGISIVGISGVAAPTAPTLSFIGGKKSGTSYGAIADSEPLVRFSNSWTTPKFDILGDGSVGIRDTSPDAQLDVNVSSSGVIGQIIQGAPSQSANLQEWQDSSGSALAYIDSSGNYVGSNPEATNGIAVGAGGITRYGGGGGNIILVGSGVGTQISSGSSTNTGLVVKGAASQSANLTEWQNSGGSTLAYVDASGDIFASDGQTCTAANGLCGGASSGGGWTNTSTVTSTGLNVNVTSGNLTIPNGRLAVGSSMFDSYIAKIACAGPACLHIDSSADANIEVDRQSTSDVSAVQFTTAGSDKWAIGMDDDSTENFYIGNTWTFGSKYVTVESSTGYVGIGDTTPNELLEVAGNINSTGGDICISGGNCLSTAGGGNVSGSGSTNTLTKWTGSGTIGDSIVSESGSTLTVAGNISMPSSFYIGNGASVSDTNAIAIGPGATTDAGYTVVIGSGAQTDDSFNTDYAVVIGPNAYAGDGAYSVVLGYNARSWTNDGIAIGRNSLAAATGGVAIGRDAYSVAFGTALGYSANNSGARGIAIGYASSNPFANSIALGRSATSTDTNQFMVGSSGYNLNTYIYGNLQTTSNIFSQGGFSTYDTSPADNTVETGTLCLGNGVNCITTWDSVNGSADGTAGWSNTSTWTSTDLNVNVTTGNLTVPNGRVGIGTASPSYALDVAGDVNIRQADAYRIGGVTAVRLNTTSNSVVIGDTAASLSNNFIVAVGKDAGAGAGSNFAAQGASAGQFAGSSFAAQGVQAGYYAGDSFAAQGYLAGRNAGSNFAAQGYRAGHNAGSNFAAQGYYAGYSAGSSFAAQGYLAGQSAGSNFAAQGYFAGQSAGSNFAAQGYYTGDGAGSNFTAQGNQAGYYAGDRFTAIGYQSTDTNDLSSPAGIDDSIAIGYQSDPRYNGHFLIKQANLNSKPLIQGDLTSGKVAIGPSTATSANDFNAQLEVESQSSTTTGLIVQGAASQSANLTEWQNSGGTPLAYVNASGTIYDASGQVCTASNGLCNQTDTTLSEAQVEGYIYDNDNTLSGPWTVAASGTNDINFDSNTFVVDVSTNRVGIGTASPSYALDVAGDVNIREADAYRIGGVTAVRLNTTSNSVVIGDTTANPSNSGIVAVGKDAGYGAGSNFAAQGFAAGQSAGSSFAAQGYDAGYRAGSNFAAQGYNAGSWASSYFAAQGYNAGFNAGSSFAAQGYQAGQNSGSNFTAQGYNAGYNAGSNFTAQGYQAGYRAGDRFIAIGYQSTDYTLSTPTNINDSIAIGYQSDPRYNGHFLIKQANLNSKPLIQGDLTSGKVAIGPSTATSANDFNAQLEVESQASTTTGLIVQGAASQSANLTEWQNSGGSALAYVNASGTIYDASGQVCTASNGLCNQSDTLASVLAQGNNASSYNIDMNTNLITNIGNAGTDFTSGGGLTLAGTLDVTNNLIQFGGSDFLQTWGTGGLGLGHGQTKSGNYNTLIGESAGSSNSGTQITAIGSGAGISNTQNYITVTGFDAGYQNSGQRLTAFGWDAGYSNTGDYATLTGHMAGQLNKGDYVAAFGYDAGHNNHGNYSTGLGNDAISDNDGNYVTAVGSRAGQLNKGNYSSGFGAQAIYNNSGNNVVALGYHAGMNNTANDQFIVQQANVNSVPLIQGNFSSGNVGIGTNSPTQRLDVNGSINVTGVADGSYTCYMYNPNGGCMLGGNSTCNILFSPDGSLQTAVCN